MSNNADDVLKDVGYEPEKDFFKKIKKKKKNFEIKLRNVYLE